MKYFTRKALAAFIAAIAVTSPMYAKGTTSTTEDKSIVKLIFKAQQTRVAVQKIVRSYLYMGNNIAVTKSEKELNKALKIFDSNLKNIFESSNNPKLKNLIIFIASNKEEMIDILKQPYSLDSAQELIDLGEATSEGMQSIIKKLKAKLKKPPSNFMGKPKYYATQISKYYIAYRAGIKDKNTIKNMNRTVSDFDKILNEMKSFPGNTPDMNKIVNKVEKKWKIVKQFYLDIEEGDLPLIVYETTTKLMKEAGKYAKMLSKKMVQINRIKL